MNFGSLFSSLVCMYVCRYVILELVETEKDYVRDLGLIVEVKNAFFTIDLLVDFMMIIYIYRSLFAMAAATK